MSAETTKLKRAILEYLRAQGCWIWNNDTIGNSGRRLSNNSRGAADLIGLTRYGTFIAVEIKAGKDKLNADQQRHRSEILVRNGLHLEARSIEEVITFAKQHRIF